MKAIIDAVVSGSIYTVRALAVLVILCSIFSSVYVWLNREMLNGNQALAVIITTASFIVAAAIASWQIKA